MSKLSDLNPNKHRKIMCYGSSGTGKTVFACGFPGKKLVLDFDAKISSAASFYAANKELIAEIDYETYIPLTVGDRPIQRFEEKLRELEKFPRGNFPFDVVILDSFTTFVDSMMSDIIVSNPSVSRTRSPTTNIPAMLDYRIQNIHVKSLITRLLALPCTFILLAHIKTEKDELTGRILNLPNAPGGLAVHLPVVFEEVYRTFVETKGQERLYKAQTQSDDSYQARTQIKGLAPVISLSATSLK